MRLLAMIAAGAIVVGATATVNAAPMSGAGVHKDQSIILVQEKKKESTTSKVEKKVESTTEKVKKSVKRAWKRVAGYKYNVQCLLQETKTCRETGKTEADARAKCQAQHPLCVVSDAK
jgi:basic membrane lipoprotein Med (substrate-binding protein (PBP1-ABC) superfamily)